MKGYLRNKIENIGDVNNDWPRVTEGTAKGQWDQKGRHTESMRLRVRSNMDDLGVLWIFGVTWLNKDKESNGNSFGKAVRIGRAEEVEILPRNMVSTFQFVQQLSGVMILLEYSALSSYSRLFGWKLRMCKWLFFFPGGV